MKKFLLVLLMVGLWSSAKGQVALPSLDPTLSGELPSVSAFRLSSSIAAGYATGKGKSDTVGNEMEQKVSAASVLFAWKGESLALEGVYNSFTMAMEGKESQAGLKVDFDASFTNIYLSYLLGEFLGLGLGQANESGSFKVDFSGFQQMADTTKSTLLVSGTFALAESFFISAGMNSVKEKAEQTVIFGVSTTLDPVELSYNETVAGVGFLAGDPGGFQFKLEASMTSSPEVIEETTATKWGMVSPKISEMVGLVEVKFDTIFLHASSKSKSEAKVDAVDNDLDENEKVTTATSLGVGFAPEAGLTYNFYLENETETEKDTGGDVVSSSTMYSFAVGYVF